MSEDYPHKRRFPRIPSENAVLVQKIEDHSIEGFGKTRVVGLGGCMFIHDSPLERDSLLELLISIHGGVIKAKGRVVYENPKGPSEIEVGVEFLEISDPDRAVLQSLFPPDSP